MIELGPFRLDASNGLLLRGDEPVAVGLRAVALLRALVERPGALVSKDALIEAAWPNQVVEDSNLPVQIAALRRTLSKAPGGDRWIETMPRRGYRFVGPVIPREGNSVTTVPPQTGTQRDAVPIRNGEAERRQITALSCELACVEAAAGGTGLEDLHETVGDFRRCVSETAARHAGVVYRHLGNNALVLFGYPEACEHDGEHAVHAGLELCAAIGDLRPAARVRCRIGIATGVVIIGEVGEGDAPRDREIVGDVPNIAARLLASAQPDTVAIGSATRRLIGDLFDCRELAAIDANGGSAPMRCWQVLAESRNESRFEALRPETLTPFVGRAEEIEFLLRRWRRAKSGEGQAVLLAGEPGIGKSRLAAVLSEELRDELHSRLRCFCSPYHAASPLYPAIAQLGHAAKFGREDDDAAKREKLAALLARTAATAEETELVGELLSLPPGEGGAAVRGLAPRPKKERIFAALLRQLASLAQEAPVVMLFEDTQWADPSSIELLDRVIERIANLPVLLLVTFRPEFDPPWANLPHVASLALARLGRRETVQLAEQAAGGKPLPDEIIDRIADHADGVPLAVEELTRSVIESGLVRNAAHRWVLGGPLPPFAIPATLRASLAERLDRVATARPVAEIGAAIGRQFSYELVQAVSGASDDELQATLALLVEGGLVHQRGAPPDAVYSFKHALVQDAAKERLLRDARRQLHVQIADALEIRYPELMETQPEVLAQHYAEAGLVEKSVTYWRKAGRRSAGRSAMAEAAMQLQKGLDQLACLPDTPERQRQELEFLSALGAVLTAAQGHGAPAAGRAYARARELWEQLDFPSEFIHIPYGQSRNHLYRSELDLALRTNEDLLRLSRQRNDPAGLVLGHYASGLDLLVAGGFVSSRSHLEEMLALYNPVSHHSPVHQAGFHAQVGSRAYLGNVLFCLGYPDQALAQSTLAIAEARRLAHSPSLAAGLAIGARLLSLTGNDAALNGQADELVALSTEQSFPLWVALGTIYRGWVKVKDCDGAEGISLMRSALTTYRATETEVWMPHFIALLAGACAIARRPEEGLVLLEEALQIAERSGERWFAAELNRQKGRLLLCQGYAEAAEELYRKALGIAREQEAKLWELRAAASLAGLRRDQGRRAEARDLLAPVYGWFTEGFDTRDLTEAKALLDGLT